jgi:hypothetical protein
MFREVEVTALERPPPAGQGPFSLCWVEGWADDGDPLGGEYLVQEVHDLIEAAWCLAVFGPAMLLKKVDGEVVVLDASGQVARRGDGQELRLRGRCVLREFRQWRAAEARTKGA